MFQLAVVFVKNMRLSGNPGKWLTQQHEPLGMANAYGGIVVSKSGSCFAEHDKARGVTARRTRGNDRSGAEKRDALTDAKVAENVLRAMWPYHLTGESKHGLLQLLQRTLAATSEMLAQEHEAHA
jgi:hypothetical protein